MWASLKEFVGQKKGLAVVLSIVAWVGGRFGLNLDPEVLLPAVLPLWVYIFGQGIADMGKEKAKVEKFNSSPPGA